MRVFRLIAAAAFVAVTAPAFAQGPSEGPAEKPSDPAQLKAIDEAYAGRCTAAASKELCACVISVANSQISDLSERQVFYDFMMGDVDKAKTARALFSPVKNSKFNQTLQKADVMLGNNCDKLKPQQDEQPAQKQPTSAQP